MKWRKKQGLIPGIAMVMVALILPHIVHADGINLQSMLQPLAYLDLSQIYDQYSVVIDLFIFTLLFIGVARVGLERRFPGRSGKVLCVGFGIALALGLAATERQYGFSLRSFGPIAAVVLLLVLGVFILKKHIKKLRPNEKIEEVIRDDGRRAVIDLLLAREVPQNFKNRREFLVVEIKRPSQKIDLEIKAQIESYALVVVEDERFSMKDTHWTFLAISNEMTHSAETTINQSNLPHGYFHVTDHFRIGLATWAEVLQQCRTRLELFREKLDYNATIDDGVSLLNQRYEKYLPSALLQENMAEQDVNSAS